MATPTNLDISGWAKQPLSPIYDGNNPARVKDLVNTFAYPYAEIASITINSIVTASTSTEAPMALFASASDVSATGSRTNTNNSINPYTDLEFSWLLTKNDDSAVEDLEGLTDPRDGSAFNPYTDQVSPEFSCIIREAGSYKLKLTARGFSAVTNTLIEQTATTTVTVTESTLSKVWYDGASGDDANDGLDPWGFGLTTASYTHSTRELTQSGAFASYVHDVSVPYTFRDNYIYITLAGVTGLYEIESKVSNDTIVLKTGLGSDQSNVTSSNGPKQSFTGGGTSGEESMIKDGVDYNFSSSFKWTGKANPLALTGYGGQPTVYTTGSSAIISLGTSASATTPDYVRLSNLLIDPQNGAGTSPAGSVVGTLTSTVDTGTRTIILDTLTAQNGSNETEVALQCGQANPIVHILFYNMYVDGRYNSTGRSSSRQGIFTNFNIAGSWSRALAITIDNDADNSTLDHFWYPSQRLSNFHAGYSEFRNGSGNNYGINCNTSHDDDHVCVNNCKFGSSSNWCVDASSSNNDQAAGTFSNFVFTKNLCNTINAPIFQYCMLTSAVSFNQAYGGVTSRNFFNQATPANFDGTAFNGILYGNEVYGQALYGDNNGVAKEIQDNVAWQTDDDVVFDYNLTAIGAKEFDCTNNNLYAPNKTGGTIIEDGGVNITLAAFNSDVGGTNTSTEPSWTDPASGDFGGLPTGRTATV